MKQKNNAGFSLVEVLVAIVLLGALVVPICTSLVLTYRLNDKTDNLLRARLGVSSAVETLLAEGIDESLLNAEGDVDDYLLYPDARFSDVKIEIYIDDAAYLASPCNTFYVKFTSRADESVVVETYVRESEVAAS